MEEWKLIIRSVKLSDLDAVADLLGEMDLFYGEPFVEPKELKIDRMSEILFGSTPSARLVIARRHDSAPVAGIAAYSFLWPASGTTKSLYLKELYVASDYRRQGIARLLMEFLQEIVEAERCSRMEWTTDRDNLAAQRFYEAIGAAPRSDKLFYRQEPSQTE